MTQLTKNFTLEEFERSKTAEENGICNKVENRSPEILSNINYLCYYLLQPIRNKYEKPMNISSGYRCKKLNELVGGSKTSQHMKGQAADISFNTFEERDSFFNLVLMLKLNGLISFDQMIKYDNKCIVHLSKTKKEDRNEVLSYEKRKYINL